MYFRDSFANIRISFGAISLGKLLGYQFEILHWPGLYASDWFDRIGLSQLGLFATAVSGYLDTILLLIVCISAIGSLRPRNRMRPSQPDAPMGD